MTSIAAEPTPLHRNKDFRRLWIGQACSELGSGASSLAYPLLILALTGSAVQAGLVASLRLAASVLLGLPAGALVDRWNRRRVMLSCEAVRAAAMGLLVAVIATGHASVPLILAIAVVEAGASAFFGPAQTAALRHIVPTAQLPTASARNEARSYAAELGGPPLGGALFGIARSAPFVLDAVSYLASWVAVARIRQPLQEDRPATHEPLRKSIWMGLRFMTREPFLRAVFAMAPLMNASFGGVMFVLVVELRNQGAPAAGIGATQSLVLVGGLLGALIAPWLQPRIGMKTLIIAFSWLIFGLFGVAAAMPSAYAAAALLAVCLLCAPAINAGLFGYVIAMTPDAMQGRVSSAGDLLSQGLQPVAPLIGGVLVAHAGGHWAFAFFAGVLGVAAIIATTSRGIREMRPIEDIR